MSHHKAIAKSVGSWLVVTAITFVLAEVTLRLAFSSRLAVTQGDLVRGGEEKLTRRDAQLGWSYAPNAHAAFTNGFVTGDVHIDEHGLRQNAAATTFQDAAPTIFMIGDSNTAELEVDD